ncbi:hypothetical protein L7F22_063884 [Adiantum nelumboides]|nr:hypothetical protein [Adiantum nelumboides]
MPDPSDADYSLSYDFFFRGQEILSGAQRVHDATMLESRMKEAGIAPEDMKSYVDAFRMGCPPHAGAGIGLERVVMFYLAWANIRRASMFPPRPKEAGPGLPAAQRRVGRGGGTAAVYRVIGLSGALLTRNSLPQDITLDSSHTDTLVSESQATMTAIPDLPLSQQYSAPATTRAPTRARSKARHRPSTHSRRRCRAASWPRRTLQPTPILTLQTQEAVPRRRCGRRSAERGRGRSVVFVVIPSPAVAECSAA